MAIKLSAGEQFKPINFSFKKSLLRNQYAVSNKGRLLSYKEEFSDGKILKGTLVQGYRVFKAKPNGENITLFIHKLVAEYFVPKGRKKTEFVIHLDHNKLNNNAENLAWVDREGLNAHLVESPKLKAYYKRGKKEKKAIKDKKIKIAKQGDSAIIPPEKKRKKKAKNKQKNKSKKSNKKSPK